MADKVKFRVHCTPLEDIQDENSQIHTVMSSEIGRTLGGAGECVIADYNPALGGTVAADAAVQGYLNKAPSYLSADDGGDTTDISSETTASFVFIKNTGRKFDTVTALGDAYTASLKVMSASTMISVLAPGEAIILKDANRGLNCTTIHVRTVATNGTTTSDGNLAVEYLVVD